MSHTELDMRGGERLWLQSKAKVTDATGLTDGDEYYEAVTEAFKLGLDLVTESASSFDDSFEKVRALFEKRFPDRVAGLERLKAQPEEDSTTADILGLLGIDSDTPANDEPAALPPIIPPEEDPEADEREAVARASGLAYHGAPAQFVEAIRKAGGLKPYGADGVRKINAGNTTEAGLIWVTFDYSIADHFAKDGDPIARSFNPDLTEGEVFTVRLPSGMKMIDRGDPLTQEQVDILNKEMVPDYKPLHAGDDLGNFEWRVKKRYVLKDALLALGYNGMTYGPKQVAVISDFLPLVDNGITESAATFEDEAHKAATSPTNTLSDPTQPQLDAGTYQKGHPYFQGIPLTIENPQGSIRRGVCASGVPWETEMIHHYGYIKGTVGRDKDHLDVFVGSNLEAATAFIVDQIRPDTGKFDEHKVMLGFNTEGAARDGYLANYDKGWQGLGAITAMDMDAFKLWIKGDTYKPISGKILESAGVGAITSMAGIRRAFAGKFPVVAAYFASTKKDIDTPDIVQYLEGDGGTVQPDKEGAMKKIPAGMKLQDRAMCSICGRQQAVTGTRIADHGYTLWRGVSRSDSCGGSGRAHFGTEKGRDFAAKAADDLEASISKRETWQEQAAVTDMVSFIRNRLRDWEPREAVPTLVEIGGVIHLAARTYGRNASLCTHSAQAASQFMGRTTEEVDDVTCTRCQKEYEKRKAFRLDKEKRRPVLEAVKALVDSILSVRDQWEGNYDDAYYLIGDAASAVEAPGFSKSPKRVVSYLERAKKALLAVQGEAAEGPSRALIGKIEQAIALALATDSSEVVAAAKVETEPAGMTSKEIGNWLFEQVRWRADDRKRSVMSAAEFANMNRGEQVDYMNKVIIPAYREAGSPQPQTEESQNFIRSLFKSP